MATITAKTPGACSCCGGPSNLWFFGRNFYGENGSGIADTDLHGPTKVGAETNWVSVSTFDGGALGIKVDGTIWFWGLNVYGQNGSGVADNVVYPITQIGTATNWVRVFALYCGGFGIKADGTLWFWGKNYWGFNGSGISNFVVYTPTQVGSDVNWLSVVQHDWGALGLKTDGTIWFWGRNEYGLDGSGVAVSGTVYSPTRIGSATNWVSISAALGSAVGIKSDGTLWAWGVNYNAILGNGISNGSIFSPTQIGTATNWVAIETTIKAEVGVFGLRSDGTLWFWGKDSTGLAGDGNTLFSAIYPMTQVDTATDWVGMAMATCGFGVKADGTLWFWGWNSYGQNGSGVADSGIYTPTQIGTATNWASIAAYSYGGMGIST